MVTWDPTAGKSHRGEKIQEKSWLGPLALGSGGVRKLREVTALPGSASPLAPSSPALAEQSALAAP